MVILWNSMTSTSFVFTELANTMKYGEGLLYNLVFTKWRHCVSQNKVWGRGCYITLFSPSGVTAFHRIETLNSKQYIQMTASYSWEIFLMITFLKTYTETTYCYFLLSTYSIRYTDPMLVQCWTIFCDADPTLSQRRISVSCLLGISS